MIKGNISFEVVAIAIVIIYLGGGATMTTLIYE